MLVGRRGRDKGIFPFLRASPNKVKGLTLVEVLVSAFILLVIIAALFIVLNIGNLSNAVSGAKLELQQDVRRAMDWIIKDFRQTSRQKLTVPNPDPPPDRITFVGVGNNEIFTDPEFYTCQGHDGEKTIWSPNQIGYSFDVTNQKIIRIDTDTSQTWTFNHISNLEFRKIYINLMRVTITGEKTIRGNIKPTFTLVAEIKLRNEE